jgi:hypothetical protein
VIDVTGRPVSRAAVEAERSFVLDNMRVSKEDGTYALDLLRPGRNVISVTRSGYHKLSVPVVLGTGIHERDFVLRPLQP